MVRLLKHLQAWRLKKRVRSAVRVFCSAPRTTQEEILHALKTAGLSAPEAWEILQFVPIAFCHVVMREEGVTFPPTYLAASWTDNQRARRTFTDVPLYLAATLVAKHALANGSTKQDLIPVFGLSAEYAAISQVKNLDGSIHGITVTEPLLFGYLESSNSSTYSSEVRSQQ